MNQTILALVGYLSWTVLLVICLGAYRTVLVMQKERAANGFKADGSDSPAFGYRLTRAFGNCVESFAFIGGAMLIGLATSSAAITDPLALWLLMARVGQSVVHIVSTSVLAVQIRFALFLVQIGIVLYWLFQFYTKFSG